MSRGPGIWQRRLLEALEKQPALFLVDLLPTPYKRGQYAALHRAACTLCSQGKLDWRNGLAGGTNSRWVCRPGYECNWVQVLRGPNSKLPWHLKAHEARKGDAPVSVETGPPSSHDNTYSCPPRYRNTIEVEYERSSEASSAAVQRARQGGF